MTDSPGLVATVRQFASGLRFPTLFFITASLFTIDLLVPDMVPLADEILLALGTLLLGSLRKRVRDRTGTGDSEQP